MSDKCPKCGAERTGNSGALNLFDCGSDCWDDGGNFDQSDSCRIAELTQRLATAEQDRDEAKANVVNKIKQPGEWMNSLAAQMDMDFAGLHEKIKRLERENKGLREKSQLAWHRLNLAVNSPHKECFELIGVAMRTLESMKSDAALAQQKEHVR